MDTINTIFHNLLGGLLAWGYVLIMIALVAGAIAIVKFPRNNNRNTIGSNNTFNANINQQTGDGNINNKDKV